MITRARRLLAKLFRAKPRRPVPIAITWGGLNQGESPYVDVRYPVTGKNTDELEVLLNDWMRK